MQDNLTLACRKQAHSHETLQWPSHAGRRIEDDSDTRSLRSDTGVSAKVFVNRIIQELSGKR